MTDIFDISINELEQKIALGEEVIDTYFDPQTTKVAVPQQIQRRNHSPDKSLVTLPDSLFSELEAITTELGISCDAVITMMLRRSLDEHDLAQKIPKP